MKSFSAVRCFFRGLGRWTFRLDPTFALVMSVAPALLFAQSSLAATFVVSSLGDSGDNTLRWAIEQANDNPGNDIITFSVAGTILPISPLPDINDLSGRLTITGDTSEIGTTIDGSNLFEIASGLRITSGSNTISNLTIIGFDQAGIEIDGPSATSNAIVGCRLGILDGFSVPNGVGIRISGGASNNRVGLTGASVLTTISGNRVSGVTIAGVGTTNNRVVGCIIGLSENGFFTVPNLGAGVLLSDGASDNTIGGVTLAARNYISGNNVAGIAITGADTTGNAIEGNFIGTDLSGEGGRGNGAAGVSISSPSNIVGGDTGNAGNRIAFSVGPGVLVSGRRATGNSIRRNAIFGNTLSGITLARGNNRIQPPAITAIDVDVVSGSTLPNSDVDVFVDAEDQGEVFIGSAVSDADGNFSVVFNRFLYTGSNVTATVTDSEGNTSRFSDPFAIAPTGDIGSLTGTVVGAVEQAGRKIISQTLGPLSCATVIYQNAFGFVGGLVSVDLNGQYEFVGVPVGQWTLQIDAPGYEPTEAVATVFPDTATDTESILANRIPIGTISGVVRDDTSLARIPETEVTAFLGKSLSGVTHTCLIGLYEIQNSDNYTGPVTLVFNAKGYVTQYRQVVVTAGRPIEVNALLAKEVAKISTGSVLVGVVGDADGPLETAAVTIRGDRDNTASPPLNNGEYAFDVTQGSQYQIKVTARGHKTDHSTVTITQSGITEKDITVDIDDAPLAPPTEVDATNSTFGDKVRVTWTETENAQGYEVWRGTTDDPTAAWLLTSVVAPEFDDTTAAPGVTYYYWVSASTDDATSELGGPDTGVRAGSALAMPTGLTATNGSLAETVLLTWNAVAGATSYEVRRNTVNNVPSSILIATTPQATYTDAALNPGTTYFYWVKALNATGASQSSVPAIGATAPGPPTAVSASDGAFRNKIVVSWTAASGAGSYEIWRSTLNASASAQLIATTVATTFDDMTAAGGTTYYYWLKSKTGILTSTFSFSDSGSRGSGGGDGGGGSSTLLLLLLILGLLSGGGG